MTPQSVSTVGKFCDEAMLSNHDGIRSGEENDSAHDVEDSAVAKVACERCRRRKIKCDRHNPCSQCSRASYQCSYPELRNRAKRQRILVSSLYESKLELITNKLDDLVGLMQQSDVASRKTWLQSSVKSTDLHEASKPTRPNLSTVPDHEGIDTPLLVNALQIADLLETALIDENPGAESRAIADIRSSRQTLQAVSKSQGRHSSFREGPPFARSLLPGMTLRDLPTPPIEKIMACVRMVQDRGIITAPWLGETKSFGDFTLIIIKICSPGPVSDAELIISLFGLYWMFTICTRWASREVRHALKEQARVCSSSLEVVLSSLSFWVPTTVDAALAMYLAALYCMQKGKIHACWTFISKAVTLAQALGLHVAPSATEASSEERHRRFCLFWSIYCLERSTALRLAHPSAIHDEHVTIPKPEEYPSFHGLTSSRQSLIHSVEASRIFGRTYDDLFSPSALALPAGHRTISGQALAAEWNALLAAKELHMAKWTEDLLGTAGDIVPVDFAKHASRATDYLLLMVIHRVALSQSSMLASDECMSSARRSLYEHTKCIALLLSYDGDPALFELWINGGLILFPYTPFNTIFCNVIESGNLADLEILKALIDNLLLLSKKAGYSLCEKQLDVFRALYTVAAVHTESRCQSQLRNLPSSATPHGLKYSAYERLDSAPVRQLSSDDQDETWNGSINLPPVPHSREGQAWVDFGGIDLHPLDPLGTHLGYWIQQSEYDLNSCS